MNRAAEMASAVFLAFLVAVVIRNAVMAKFRAARRSSMASAVPDRRRTSVRLVIAWVQVATLAAAGTCWAASRLAGTREKRADRQWMGALGDAR